MQYALHCSHKTKKKYHVFDVVHVNVRSACKIIWSCNLMTVFYGCLWVFGLFENYKDYR